MNPRPMYAFLAGLFLMFVGYSLQQGGRPQEPVFSYVGLGMLILGGALIIGSLVIQARKGRDA